MILTSVRILVSRIKMIDMFWIYFFLYINYLIYLLIEEALTKLTVLVRFIVDQDKVEFRNGEKVLTININELLRI